MFMIVFRMCWHRVRRVGRYTAVTKMFALPCRLAQDIPTRERSTCMSDRPTCARCGGWASTVEPRWIPANRETKQHFAHAWEEEGGWLHIALCRACEANEHAREQAVQTRALVAQTAALTGVVEDLRGFVGVPTASVDRVFSLQEQRLEIEQRREAR